MRLVVVINENVSENAAISKVWFVKTFKGKCLFPGIKKWLDYLIFDYLRRFFGGKGRSEGGNQREDGRGEGD